jgi:hypothetical protein
MSNEVVVYEADGKMNTSIAYLLLNRQVDVAARCALGDGLPARDVAAVLRTLADAIETPWTVAEDMSPISVPME